jgi:hypothetical protein
MRSRISKTNKFLPKHRSWKELNILADINKIEEVSMKFKNEEQDSEIQEFKIKTKTPSGKNSIYVEALQSISNSRKINPSRGFSFNLRAPLTGNLIRTSAMLEAHITCGPSLILDIDYWRTHVLLKLVDAVLEIGLGI